MLAADDALEIRAGARARAVLRERGLQPRDIVALAAAAGGPKGLALMALDQLLFCDWLKRSTPATPRLLVGASIGAWRLSAGSQVQAQRALHGLAAAYLEQRYAARPTAEDVSRTCRHIAAATVVGAHDAAYRLAVVTARSRGLLGARHSRARFGVAALANLASRRALPAFFERVVFTDGALGLSPFDGFGLREVALDDDNRIDALLASGTIPLLASPVHNPAGAPAGQYWDGGLIDYHIDWPWHQLDGLVLYPHFVPYIVPGWLDKSLFWRRAASARVSNLILVAPSAALLATLPRQRLPERQDFYHYGAEHERRKAAWREAMQRCAIMAEAFLRFADDPGRFTIGAL